ncbi:hypothetical protein AV530_011845 [Patagioenas fasciata monilis]|uniref:Secreted protein n=1 Tax=Patagioenas fasciata monilis TaxID=372326 RepID=A0A1V4JUB5_PATFA|nr:hypothetical protein AV530_011845 [Patagioenas fasciata monilis]
MKVAVTTVQSVLCLWHLLRILNTIMSKTGKKHPKNGNLLKAPCTFHAEDLADLFLVLSRYLERRWVGSTFLLAAQAHAEKRLLSQRHRGSMKCGLILSCHTTPQSVRTPRAMLWIQHAAHEVTMLKIRGLLHCGIGSCYWKNLNFRMLGIT